MDTIDRTRIYRGSGVLKYNGQLAGALDDVAISFQEVEADMLKHQHNPKSIYGTVTGKLDLLELVPKGINNLGPMPGLIIEATVSPVGVESAELIEIEVSEVDFVDEVPYDGVFKEHEFHGTSNI